MARPGENPPEWGTAETNDTEPGSGQKATGWVLGQVAISGFQNWWQRVTYEWTSWFKGVLDGNEGDWRLTHTRTDASQTPIVIGSDPEAGTAGNAWKKLFRANAGGSRNFRILSGKVSQSAGVIFTLNVDWDPPTQTWSLEDSSANAFAIALDWGSNGLTCWFKAAGSGPWGPVAWDEGTATLGTLVAETLDVSADADVDGELTVEDLVVENDVTLHNTGELAYDLAKTVTYVVDMREGQKGPNLTYFPQPGSAADVYKAEGGDAVIDLPLRVPQGCTVVDVTAVCEQSGGGDVVNMNVFTVTPNFATGGHIKGSAGSMTSTGSTGTEVMPLTLNHVSLGTGSPPIYYARFTISENAYVRMGVRVRISTLNVRHY